MGEGEERKQMIGRGGKEERLENWDERAGRK
jgi:hypothetical protein